MLNIVVFSIVGFLQFFTMCG